jgi:hypothetical protein
VRSAQRDALNSIPLVWPQTQGFPPTEPKSCKTRGSNFQKSGIFAAPTLSFAATYRPNSSELSLHCPPFIRGDPSPMTDVRCAATALFSSYASLPHVVVSTAATCSGTCSLCDSCNADRHGDRRLDENNGGVGGRTL